MPTPGIGTSVAASDIITRAAKALGYLGRTETLSAADATDGLHCLNALLDSWAGENLTAWAINQQQFTLTIGQGQYTIGTIGSPNINNTRPIDINSAFIRDTQSIDSPLSVVDQRQWDAISQKGTTGQIPHTLYYDSQYPLGIVNIFPVPMLAYTVFYSQVLQQGLFDLLTTQLSTPPGYARAYVMNLAVEMMSAGFPCLLNAAGLVKLLENAAEAKANIKRMNMINPLVAEYDGAIVSNSYAPYNIFTDS